MTKTHYIYYHSKDYDGIMCGAIALYWLCAKGPIPRDRIEMIGWDYKDAQPARPPENAVVYIMDIHIESLMDHPGLIWIDHHKTAIEQYDAPVVCVGETPKLPPYRIRGYRIDGVAACRLAWQWFQFKSTYPTIEGNVLLLPRLEAYVNREVFEPLLIRLAGEFDMWDKRDPRAELIQLGLRANGFSIEDGVRYDVWADDKVATLVDCGRPIQNYLDRVNSGLADSNAYFLEWEGLRFAVMNSATSSSFVFGDFAVLNPVDALMCWRHVGGMYIQFSLYSPPQGLADGVDLSVIAKQYGGGGHRGACGFQLDLGFALNVLANTTPRK